MFRHLYGEVGLGHVFVNEVGVAGSVPAHQGSAGHAVPADVVSRTLNLEGLAIAVEHEFVGACRLG